MGIKNKDLSTPGKASTNHNAITPYSWVGQLTTSTSYPVHNVETTVETPDFFFIFPLPLFPSP